MFCMGSFRKSIFRILDEGQELSGAEKSLINQEVEKFIENYRIATGENPRPLFDTIYLIASRLEEFGFKLPRVERWREEDMKDINSYLERTGKGSLEKRE